MPFVLQQSSERNLCLLTYMCEAVTHLNLKYRFAEEMFTLALSWASILSLNRGLH